MPGRSTSALSKVETDSALERSTTKDVRRMTSPFAARVPVNAAGGAYGARWSSQARMTMNLASTVSQVSLRGSFITAV